MVTGPSYQNLLGHAKVHSPIHDYKITTKDMKRKDMWKKANHKKWGERGVRKGANTQCRKCQSR